MTTLLTIANAISLLIVGGVAWAAFTAPEGWQDDAGFHYGREGE